MSTNTTARVEWIGISPGNRQPIEPRDEVTVAVQVNGKLRDTLTVAKGLAKDELETLAVGSAKVQAFLAGATPKKVIVVPDRLVNIVA